MIKNITQEVEIGKTYLGRVTKTTDFGAFVKFFQEGRARSYFSISSGTGSETEDVVKTGD